MFKKKLLIPIVSVIIGIGTLTYGLTGVIASPDILHFVGKDNMDITVLTDNHDSEQHYQEINSEYADISEGARLRVGQSIVFNGVEEIIFAIGKDGSYITVPNEK